MTELTGKKAPSFTLLNQDGVKCSLSDFKGQWVILYFYPKDDTPGCTTEACDFTERYKDFDAEVLGVSPDSPESHDKFISKHHLGITLLSDPEKEVMKKYQAWGTKKNYGKEYQGVIRSTMIIDPKGVIAHAFHNVRAKGHAERVKKKLEELR